MGRIILQPRSNATRGSLELVLLTWL